MVGWDLPCEHLNGYITRTVQGQVSPEAIDRAVKVYPLLQHNHSVLAPKSSEHMMKEMEADVQLLKQKLSQAIGSTWAQASKRKQGTPWTAAQNQRGRAPWLEVEASMSASGNDAVGAFIARTARRLTASYYAFLP